MENGVHVVRVLVEDKHDGFKWNLISVYELAQYEGKENFLQEFAHVCS